MTIAQAIRSALALGLAQLDAQLLLLHLLGKPSVERAWLLTHDQDVLDPTIAGQFTANVLRRLGGESVAYITGQKEFYGLDFAVDKRVLVPRPDTETLVNWALEVLARLSHRAGPPDVLDLGTGSGAVALAIKYAKPNTRVSATDISDDALAVARANTLNLKLEVSFSLGSWLSGVTGRYDLIVSNPPYIADHDPHLAALAHEPLLALASGPDGLDAMRKIIGQAPAHLHAEGWLLLEHGYDQAVAVRELLLKAGFADVQSRRDLAGIERCSGGRCAGSQKPGISRSTTAPPPAIHK